MAMSDCNSTLSSSQSPSGSDLFDFDSWIERNTFHDIKSIFIKHQMCSLSALSLHSQQFAPFISDISASHPMYIEQICSALQPLSIKSDIEQLNALKTRIAALVHKTEHRAVIQQEINTKFQLITHETEKQKQNLLNGSNAYFDNEFARLSTDINHEVHELQRIEPLLEVDISQMTQERKQTIRKIGNDARTRYNLKRKEFETRIASLNNSKPILSDVHLHKLMKYIRKIGACKLNKCETKNEHNVTNAKESEGVIINKTEQKEEQLRHLLDLRQKIESLEAIEVALRKQMDTKQTQLIDEQHKIKRLKENYQRFITEFQSKMNEGQTLNNELKERLDEKEKAINRLKLKVCDFENDVKNYIEATNLMNIERENERKEFKSYQKQIYDLQKKIKCSNNRMKMKDDEIKKLRLEVNKQRKIPYEKQCKPRNIQQHNMQTNTKRMNVKQPKQIQVKYAAKAQQNTQLIHRRMLAKMKSRFEGQNAKQFVDEFCEISKKVNQIACKLKDKTTKKVKNNNQVSQVWCCRMEIKNAHLLLFVECEAKKKNTAINTCYKKMAMRISKY